MKVTISRDNGTMRSNSQRGAFPPCSGRWANPVRAKVSVLDDDQIRGRIARYFRRVPAIGEENGMFSHRVKEVMDRKKLVKAAPSMSVHKAAKLMAAKRVGALLVVEDKKLVGIFTERDALFRVTAQGLDPESTILAEVMTTSPRTIAPESLFGEALYIMSQQGFRHLPVIAEGMPVGIVSSRSALDPDLEEFVSEERRRKHLQEAP
jgi:CBS domain-containing protein